MKGSEFARACTNLTPEQYQELVLSNLDSLLPLEWYIVESVRGGRTARIPVTNPLRLGTEDDFVWPMVSPVLAQLLADHLRVNQPTTRILDLIRGQGTIRYNFVPQPADPAARRARGYSPSMSDGGAMMRFREDNIRQIGVRRGLLGCPYKIWPITNKLTSPEDAYNYGAYGSDARYRSPTGLQMWQTLAGGHSAKKGEKPLHYDYSQLFVAVGLEIFVDVEEMLFVDVATDPVLAPLVTDEGICKVLRQPCVPDPNAPAAPPRLPALTPLTELRYERLLFLKKPRMIGQDVENWQEFLRIDADGEFGGQTDTATRQFQHTMGLLVDGKVGTASIDAANKIIAERLGAREPVVTSSTPILDLSKIAYLPARNFRRVTTPRAIDLLVIHTAEIAEQPTSAEALMSWVAGPKAPMASWHFAVDNDSITRSVLDEHIAFHAPGANERGIGIELCGYAAQTAKQWEDEYSQRVLENAAQLMAELSRKHNIPLRVLDAAALKRGERGITTHSAVSLAYKKSTHWDPGPHFPMDSLLERITELRAA